MRGRKTIIGKHIKSIQRSKAKTFNFPRSMLPEFDRLEIFVAQKRLDIQTRIITGFQ